MKTIKYKVEIIYDNDKIHYTNWYNEQDQYHRLDGPAIECADGSKLWYQNGQYHRLDGPAIEYTNGTKYWYQNGQRHRLDGPAIEYSDGDKRWYIEGKKYTEKEFKQKVSKKEDSCDGKVVEIEGIKYKLSKV